MDHMESDQTSNDDTTIISELINSAAEAMQSSVQNPTTTTVPLQFPIATTTTTMQPNELHSVNNKDLLINNNNNKQDLLVPSLQQNNVIMINNSFSSTNMDDISRLQNRHVHIPYILNGELYQIQTQDGENVTVKCCHCPPDRVYRGSVRSTGNFHMHIKRRHPDLLEKLHEMKVNALLERRDRLMRNRKITHRGNRNRTSSASISAAISSLKSEPKLDSVTPMNSQISLTSAPELALMHTHNLKIKTVFQRHQMQQREAAEMRNWSNSNYIVVPISKLTTKDGTTEEPINYSLKSQESKDETPACSLSNSTPQQQEEQGQLKEQNTSNSCNNNFTDLSKQQTTNSFIANEQNDFVCENQTSATRHLSTSSSLSASCPSTMSSYSSTHQYINETNRQDHQDFHHHNLSIIKPEHLLIDPEMEAIDLTMHNDSGISSNCTTANDDSDNNDTHNNNNITTDNRAGSQLTTSNTVNAAVDSSCSHSPNNTKWQELLIQVETSLRDVQREMNVRNQIESNRMFLDIAKFKFLHPGFQYNW